MVGLVYLRSARERRRGGGGGNLFGKQPRSDAPESPGEQWGGSPADAAVVADMEEQLPPPQQGVELLRTTTF